METKLLKSIQFNEKVQIHFMDYRYGGLYLEIAIWQDKPYPFISGYVTYGNYRIPAHSVEYGISRLNAYMKTGRVQKLLSIFGG